MSRVLLDTDVLSDIFKGSDFAMDFAPLLAGKELLVSAITVGEMEFWALKRNWGKDKQLSLRRLLGELQRLDVDRSVAEQYGLIRDHMRRIGRTMGPNDTWIAAVARTHGLALATRNKSDFQDVPGLALL